MRPFRNILMVVGLASVAMLCGCEWLLLSGAVGAGYVDSGAQTTKAFTDCSNSAGAAHVGDAVQTWLNRNQLPLPVSGEGSHNYSMRVGTQGVDVTGSRGARRVELFDNGNLIAEYVVAWDKSPEEYRVVSATNCLYDAPLDVTAVPPLPTYVTR